MHKYMLKKYLFLSYFFFSCIKNDAKIDSSQIMHPLGDEILNVDPVSLIPEIDEATDIVDLKQLLNVKLHLEIGKEFGEPYESFSRIKQIDIYENKEIIILDGEFNQIHVYDFLGNYISTFGRSGKGPGELSDPTFFEIIDNVLIVGDGLFKLELFDLDTHTYIQSINTEFRPEDLCSIGEDLYIQGSYKNDPSEGNNLIHKFKFMDESLTYLSSFGDLYPANDKWVQGRLSKGQIECDESNGYILTVNSKFPIISKYSTDGNLIWKKRIEGLKTGAVIQRRSENGNYGLTYKNEENEDFLVVFKMDVNGDLYVQYLRSNKNTNLQSMFNEARYTTLVIKVNEEKILPIISKPFPIVKINKNYIISINSSLTRVASSVSIYER